MSTDDHIELQWIKRILIAVIGALFTHFIAGVWWAATLTANVKNMESTIVLLTAEIKSNGVDKYRGVDAAKDFGVVIDRLSRNEVRISSLEQAIRNRILMEKN